MQMVNTPNYIITKTFFNKYGLIFSSVGFAIGAISFFGFRGSDSVQLSYVLPIVIVLLFVIAMLISSVYLMHETMSKEMKKAISEISLIPNVIESKNDDRSNVAEEVLFLATKSSLFHEGMHVSCYYTKLKWDIFIGNGKVKHIQEKGQIQISVLLVQKTCEGDDLLCNNREVNENITIKPARNDMEEIII